MLAAPSEAGSRPHLLDAVQQPALALHVGVGEGHAVDAAVGFVAADRARARMSRLMRSMSTWSPFMTLRSCHSKESQLSLRLHHSDSGRRWHLASGSGVVSSFAELAVEDVQGEEVVEEGVLAHQRGGVGVGAVSGRKASTLSGEQMPASATMDSSR